MTIFLFWYNPNKCGKLIELDPSMSYLVPHHLCLLLCLLLLILTFQLWTFSIFAQLKVLYYSTQWRFSPLTPWTFCLLPPTIPPCVYFGVVFLAVAKISIQTWTFFCNYITIKRSSDICVCACSSCTAFHVFVCAIVRFTVTAITGCVCWWLSCAFQLLLTCAVELRRKTSGDDLLFNNCGDILLYLSMFVKLSW